ncbi:2Fe-2S iron-sulfur cluster-binding protein [Endothiovibrio diazotrophicus]
MTHRVRLLPSGRQFEAAAGETLLEAALRSGVNLPYSCANGSCGDCKVRVVSGEVAETRFHDHRLSEAERADGYGLLCVIQALSDLEVEADEVHDVRAIPLQHLTARVSKLERLGETHLVLHLRTPRTRTLRFLSGQHAQLTLQNLLPKDLPIASCPCNGMQLQFHLRNKPEDPFCRAVFEEVKVGDTIRLDGPFGDFTLDDDSRRPVVMVAVETGFATLKSLVEHFIALDLPQPLTLWWISERDNGHYLKNYCRSWEDALDNFAYHPVQAVEGYDPEPLAAEVVAGSPAAAEIDLYLAGEEPIIDALKAAFETAGTPTGRIHTAAMRARHRR